MKQYIFILLSLLLLASCNEQDISGGSGTTGTDGSGLRLSVRLGNGTVTRAPGDPFLSESEEKRIDRLAFFVHTDEDGLQVYPPVPDDVTDATVAGTDYPNHVYLAETAAGSRQYTADVTLTAGGGYMADIVAVANLPADYDYNQIVTWDGLQDSVTVWAAEMPACTPGTGIDDPDRRALVMYGYTREELAKEETNAFTLALERLVARIDITNEAYVQGMTADDPKGGFLLTSVRMLQARPASYITPQPGYTSSDVATISDWQVTDIPYGKATALDADANPTREPDAVDAATAEADATLQYLWRTLYTYENSDTEHAPTALEIKGAFRGTEVTRRIDFIDTDKKPVPLVRNHRYLVRILPAPGQTDITFDIKVSEWDAVDTVNVKPDQTAVPVIENLDGNGVYLEKENRYDVYYKADGLLTFDATCNFSAGVRVKYYDSKNDTWTTQGDWVKVEKTAETPVTKAIAGYKSSFKITFDKFDTGVSRKAMLLVHNGGSEVECDTIFIKHTLTYPGTDLEPAALGNIAGKDIVWAPVNVGAIRLPTTAYNRNSNLELNSEELQTRVEERGFIFQWGRKYGIVPTIKVPWVPGVVSMEELQNNFGFKGKLIEGTGGNSPNNDWLTPSDNTLWGNGITKGVYDPCPGGWRVPFTEELQVLADKANADGLWDDSKCILSFSGSELVFVKNEGLYFWSDANQVMSFTYNISLWSCSIDNSTSGAFALVRYPSGEHLQFSLFRSLAFPVRCVQE